MIEINRRIAINGGRALVELLQVQKMKFANRVRIPANAHLALSFFWGGGGEHEPISLRRSDLVLFPTAGTV